MREANEYNILSLDSYIQRIISEILLNIDDGRVSESEDWINKTIDTDQRYGMKGHLGRDYALYAELYKRKGDQAKAKEKLIKAIEISRDCGADGWVGKYEKELAAIL